MELEMRVMELKAKSRDILSMIALHLTENVRFARHCLPVTLSRMCSQMLMKH